MKTYEITYSNGGGIYSANLVIAESADQATAYYTAEGHEVIGCTETMCRPKPGQPVVTVPEGWTAPAAEQETEADTETETVERAAEINPMCTDCTRRGTDCDGTTCKSFTGCIYRIGLGSSKRDETPAHITDATTAKLLDYWDYVRRLSYSAATAITRGWILDEIERRDPVGYVRWVDDDTPGDYDARLRDFICCDDAHVAWLCPQTATTWHPGDAREGARA